MEVMAMTKMTMPKMAVAMPMMAVVPMTVMAVTAMTAMTTAGESLTRGGERGSSQRQRRDGGHNRVLDCAHECLQVVQREDRSAMIQPRRAECDTM
jgi:alcohol dehydrogenase class IV